MHELNPADGQRIDRREVRSPQRTACTANACSGGDKACPCPDACRLPDNTLVGRVMDVLDRVPMPHFWIGYAAFLLASIAALVLIFG